MRKHFNVPVLPYLKKYIVKQFFAGQETPYKIEEDSLIGKQFMSLLLDARNKDLSGDKKIQMTETIEICLSDAMAKRSATLSKLISVNFYLDKMFKDDIIVWVLSAERYGIRPFTSTKHFLEHFKIEEGEYTHDACHRHWLRWKNDEYNKQKRKRLAAAEKKVTGVTRLAS